MVSANVCPLSGNVEPTGNVVSVCCCCCCDVCRFRLRPLGVAATGTEFEDEPYGCSGDGVVNDGKDASGDPPLYGNCDCRGAPPPPLLCVDGVGNGIDGLL